MVKKRILIIAGEASGELYAAELIKAVKELRPDIEFFGLGGTKMQAAGCRIDFNIVDLAVVGFFEVIRSLKKFKAVFDAILKQVDSSPVDLAILVDYPGFNLRLAKELKKRNIPVIYFISPQVWAWGKSRVAIIRKLVARMLVFFKFEEELYRKHDVPVSFIGHPLLDLVKAEINKEELFQKFKLKPSRYTIAILPGSRLREVNTHLPIMLKAADLIHQKLPGAQFLVLRSSTVKKDIFEKILTAYQIPVTIVSDLTYAGLSAADFAIVASGTATLETAILGIPMAIIYKVAFLSWLYLKTIIKLPYIGMVNIIAGAKIVPEFIQYQAKPEKIAEYVINSLSNPRHLDMVKRLLFNVRAQLGQAQATQRAAEIIVEYLKKN